MPDPTIPAPESHETVRRIEELPVFTEIDDPDFGQDWEWVANDLFQRGGNGLLRHDVHGLVVYSNTAINELGGLPDVSHQAAVPGFLDSLMEFSTFGMRQPQHRPVKALVGRQVSGKRMESFAGLAREVAAGIVPTVTDRGEFDFVSEVSKPFLRQFWSQVLGTTVDTIERLQHLIGELELSFALFPTEDDIARAGVASVKYVDMITEIIEEGIADGGHQFLNGLTADFERMGDGRPRNVASTFGVALVDAFNTAGSLAANALHLVVTSSDRYSQVRADRSLVSHAWLEASRLRTPVIATQRAAIKDIVYNDVLIPAETPITMLWLFGNRDPEVFDDPNAFRFHRENRVMQTSFGAGVYACIGRHVARLIGEAVVETFTDPALVVEVMGPVGYSRGSLVQAPERMPMRVRNVEAGSS